jgi:L-fuculose-phosphate aldolase
MREAEARTAVAELWRRVVAGGLAADDRGSVSVRLGPGSLLVSPVGTRAGALAPGDLVVTDLDGRAAPGAGRPSAAIQLHLLVYAARPDVEAVVHARPPLAPALADGPGWAGTPPPLLDAEAATTLQALVTVSNALVVDRHGALAVGSSLEEAYARLEALVQSTCVAPGCAGCSGCPQAGP